ncbi:hypothetical protein CAPTEDRAFT_174450 [Capitella teleta]|uniref:Iron-binding zinc finger CDGSH type domain-containing protein n=1 Tax=Capitella teleta TaxID=283909 RepID=R7VBC1_CAPTE|nr:hypothetical protein CAPTEDRAFT_174450 [Capitella teleta]|eukprot:ELU13000.1 hypothetical protein CAPTEDRAFT_174450 [Capitella teleta]
MAGVDEGREVYPAVAMYGPCNVEGLDEGQIKMWCSCGLSKNQPWCDGSHVDTGIKPVMWKVPKQQSLHQICACKYTKTPPYCDGTHTMLPEKLAEKKEKCTDKEKHNKESCKLCTKCSWVPDF